MSLSTLGYAIGAALLYDDAPDLGDFKRPDHPSPLHHWQVGLGLIYASLIGLLWSGARIKGGGDVVV